MRLTDMETKMDDRTDRNVKIALACVCWLCGLAFVAMSYLLIQTF